VLAKSESDSLADRCIKISPPANSGLQAISADNPTRVDDRAINHYPVGRQSRDGGLPEERYSEITRALYHLLM
jgi:hypothetical protein